MYCTTSMTLYVGSYRRERKSGFDKWGHIVMHVSPVSEDGEIYDMFNIPVDVWIADSAVNALVVLAQAGATKIESNKEYDAWKFVGDAVPKKYKNAFSELGDLKIDVIEFGEKRMKVHRHDDGRITVIRDSDGKPIVSESVRMSYWTGGMISTGFPLSLEMRKKRVLEEWISVSALITLDETKQNDENNGENDDNSNDENNKGLPGSVA